MGDFDPATRTVAFRGRPVEMVELSLRDFRKLGDLIGGLSAPPEGGPAGVIVAFSDRLIDMAVLMCPSLTRDDALDAKPGELMALVAAGFQMNNITDALKKTLDGLTVQPPTTPEP